LFGGRWATAFARRVPGITRAPGAAAAGPRLTVERLTGTRWRRGETVNGLVVAHESVERFGTDPAFREKLAVAFLTISASQS